MHPFESYVVIDPAHNSLIHGLVRAHKPQRVLEIGLGGGTSLDTILQALDMNQQAYDYTLVDNWYDWSGQRPPGVTERYGDQIQIVESSERDFVATCDQTYDFILSDGDHHHADQWFDRVYHDLLAPGGIVIYHDINLVQDEFVNLRQILYTCQQQGLTHMLFNQNSRSDERCHRGLLVISKTNK